METQGPGSKSDKINAILLDHHRLQEILTQFNAMVGCRKQPDQHQLKALVEFLSIKMGHLTVGDLLQAAADFSAGDYGDMKVSTEVLTPKLLGTIVYAWKQRHTKINHHNQEYKEPEPDPEWEKKARAELNMYFREFKKTGKLNIPDFSINFWARFMEARGLFDLTPEEVKEVQSQAAERVAELNAMPRINKRERSLADMLGEESPDLVRQINRKKIVLTFTKKLGK